MRLTQIKLSGFKSFVDPTSIHVPGQLVGVVGPNGCGKSNVIDAVRWVLGETRAAALRGDSMQDVIFNGSVNRKPMARAAVELMFDNSQGRAAGQWSQYAELSVKRVLQRDGESSYYINGTHVRRRDITDMFLGTGLGPRAYAIIEQGMISRVIEAKPEELRVFLEEAAGISKYKERRRETENRISHTKENLERLSDAQAAAAIRTDDIDVLLDVCGYMSGQRFEIVGFGADGRSHPMPGSSLPLAAPPLLLDHAFARPIESLLLLLGIRLVVGLDALEHPTPPQHRSSLLLVARTRSRHGFGRP